MLTCKESMGSHIDAVEKRLLGNVFQGSICGQRLSDRLYAFQYLLACIKRGHSIKIRTHAGRRWYRIGHLVGARVVHVDIIERNAESLRSDLTNLCVQALSHLRSAVRHENGSVCVEMYESSSLVHELSRERYAKFRRRESYSAL